MAGVDLRTVQELAGHKDIKVTMRIGRFFENIEQRLRTVNTVALGISCGEPIISRANKRVRYFRLPLITPP
jgi:hypothetical protein